MIFLRLLYFCLIGTAGISFHYKVKMRQKIVRENETFLTFISKFISPADVLPMRIRNVPDEEIANRKRANTAIYIFYGSLVALFILTFFIQNVSHTDNLYPQTKIDYYDSTKPLTDSEKVQLNDSFRKELQKPVLPKR